MTDNNKQGHINNIYNNNNINSKIISFRASYKHLLTSTKYDMISNNKQGHNNGINNNNTTITTTATISTTVASKSANQTFIIHN